MLQEKETTTCPKLFQGSMHIFGRKYLG